MLTAIFNNVDRWVRGIAAELSLEATQQTECDLMRYEVAEKKVGMNLKWKKIVRPFLGGTCIFFVQGNTYSIIC